MQLKKMLKIPGFKITGTFPAFVTAENKIFDYNHFLTVISKQKDLFQQLLLKHGALVFRDFPINSATAFADFIETLGLGNFVNYIGGDSPRDKVQNKVYTSTEAPPSLHIPLHQELSFIKNFPK